jgi:bacteriocin biosynthesis cyclodehydratase domain-containing protein
MTDGRLYLFRRGPLTQRFNDGSILAAVLSFRSGLHLYEAGFTNSMFQRPIFKPHLRVEIVEGEGLFLLSEFNQTVLQGRLYEVVAPCLDGRLVEAVCEQLAGQVSPAQVFYTLKKLEQKGCLCESEDTLPPEEASSWSVQGIDPTVAARRLAGTTVEVHGLGIDVEPLRSLLNSLHVQLGDEGDIRVVVTDDYLRPELRSFNSEALGGGRPWLLVKPVGSQVWIGPLFQPGKTACWECFNHRFRSVNPTLSYLEQTQSERQGAGQDPVFVATSRVRTAATLSVGWGLAANAVAGCVVHGAKSPQLEGRIQTIELSSYKAESHTLVKHPVCSACGNGPASVADSAPPVTLEGRKKTYADDGGYRALPPQKTLDKYGFHVSSICGTVSMLERCLPANGEVMHVYFSGSNVAWSPRNLGHLKVGLRNSTAGKGTSDVQARASALCEGLERYSGVFRGDEPRRTAKLGDLGQAAIHPNACMLFSEKQYAEREARNAHGGVFNFIPLPFDPEREIEWTPLWSLTQETTRYLPTDFCYFSYPCSCDLGFCMSCSNGNAAGNCIEEAILQGALELIERDGVCLWWYNRVRVPGVDLESFDEPYLDQLQDFLKTQGRNLWALDLTNDVGIPVFAALSRRTDDSQEEQIMFGFGAHLDPKIALLRAVTELNQFMTPIMLAAQAGDATKITDQQTLQWLQTAKLADHSYLVPSPGAARSYSSYPRMWTDDLKEDILACKSRVENLGLEMLVLDQTRSEIGMPVVKVVIPGLRHFWVRLAPGRLYEVPVKLGWLDEAHTEEQLNPIPMFV